MRFCMHAQTIPFAQANSFEYMIKLNEMGKPKCLANCAIRINLLTILLSFRLLGHDTMQ